MDQPATLDITLTLHHINDYSLSTSIDQGQVDLLGVEDSLFWGTWQLVKQIADRFKQDRPEWFPVEEQPIEVIEPPETD